MDSMKRATAKRRNSRFRVYWYSIDLRQSGRSYIPLGLTMDCRQQRSAFSKTAS